MIGGLFLKEAMTNKISNEDFANIQVAKQNAAFAQVLLEKAEAEKTTAELQLKNIILKLYVKYSLSSNDGIDNEGNIIKSESKESNENNNA